MYIPNSSIFVPKYLCLICAIPVYCAIAYHSTLYKVVVLTVNCVPTYYIVTHCCLRKQEKLKSVMQDLRRCFPNENLPGAVSIVESSDSMDSSLKLQRHVPPLRSPSHRVTGSGDSPLPRKKSPKKKRRLSQQSEHMNLEPDILEGSSFCVEY